MGELPIKRRFIHKNFDKYSDADLSIPTSSFLAKNLINFFISQ